MKRTKLKSLSPKTADRNKIWKERCLWRINYLVAKYGRLICEYCGKPGTLDSESIFGVWGHHIDGDRNNTDLSNVFIVHTATCHRIVTEQHLRVKQEGFEEKR